MVIAQPRPKGNATYADYFATPEGERWELIDGVLYQMAATPNIKHQVTAKNLVSLIDPYVSRHRLGLLLPAPCTLLLPGETAVQPDLFFVRTERFHIFGDGACEGVPDMVVEILSPSNRAHDLERKRELYARHGIPEYWILEPVLETAQALTDPVAVSGRGVYTSEVRCRAGDMLTTDRIPGLAIPVRAIFASPL